MGHFLRRTLRLTAASALAVALTACGSGDEADTGSGSDAGTSSGADPAQDAGLTLPEVDRLTAIRDTLAGTDYECVNWSDVDEGVASCLLPDDRGIHGVHITENPTSTATVIFQRSPETPGVVMGKNWVFDCGPTDELGSDGCGEIATIFDATLVEPDPQ